MLRTLFIFLLFATLPLQKANACSCGRLLEEERLQQVIDDAYFIGVVKTTDIIIAAPETKHYVLELKEAYKGKSGEEIIIVEAGINSCRKHPPDRNGIGERIIYKRHNKEGSAYFIVAEQCEHNLFNVQWEKLKNQSPYIALHNYKTECENSDGVFVEKGNDYNCHYKKRIKANDYGEKCMDSDECEGACEVKPDFKSALKMRFQKKTLDAANMSIEHGVCSKYTNAANCYYAFSDNMWSKKRISYYCPPK